VVPLARAPGASDGDQPQTLGIAAPLVPRYRTTANVDSWQRSALRDETKIVEQALALPVLVR